MSVTKVITVKNNAANLHNCRHSEKEAIDRALVKGTALRTIADRWSVSKTSLIRHKADHLPAALVKANGAAQAAHADDLLAKVRQLEAEARRIGGKAEKAKDHRTAISAVRELTRIIELLAKLNGELQNAPQVVNIMTVGPVILRALESFPEARAAVAARLHDLDSQALLDS